MVSKSKQPQTPMDKFLGKLENVASTIFSHSQQFLLDVSEPTFLAPMPKYVPAMSEKHAHVVKETMDNLRRDYPALFVNKPLPPAQAKARTFKLANSVQHGTKMKAGKGKKLRNKEFEELPGLREALAKVVDRNQDFYRLASSAAQSTRDVTDEIEN